MRRKMAMTLCLLMPLLTAMALIAPVKAPDGYPFGWVEPAYVGEDLYYDEYIVGYLQGTNWNLSLSYTNYYGYPVNISTVRVYFDWGKNYTYRFATPVQLMPGETKVFSAYNVTPSIAEASELWTHWYDIWLDNVNSTQAPYEELYPIYINYGYSFAVLSADHLACLNLWAKYGMFFWYYDGPYVTQPQMYPFVPFYTNISQVQVLITQAFFEFIQGFQIFQAGVFGTAKTHLQAGENLINEALSVWSDRGTAMEDAAMNLQTAQANYYNALGDSSRMNAYGWFLFGLGWVFIGIGIIIYGFRKPKAA